MRVFLIFLFSAFFILSCSLLGKKDANKGQQFITFHNDIKLIGKADDDLFYDKGFSISVPNKLLKSSKVVSYYFLNELIFDDEQRIISLYIPNEEFVGSYLNVRYCNSLEFKEILEEIELYSLIEHVDLIPNRKFTINLVDGNFFLMYLNVKDKNVNDFNESLQSLEID